MALYLKTLGFTLCVAGLAGSLYCWQGVRNDEGYYRAARALEKHPGNVLYTREFKIAEPRHMLLLAGTFSALPCGLVWGSLCFGVASLMASQRRS